MPANPDGMPGLSERPSRPRRGVLETGRKDSEEMNPLAAILSTAEAAAILNLTEERVLQFVRAGRIEGRQLKREWVLSRASVLAFKRKPRKDGRPKNER